MSSKHSDRAGVAGDAYVSPLVDFVGLTVVTLLGAAALTVLFL